MFSRFFRSESTGGVALAAATIAALVWANLGGGYATMRDYVVCGHSVRELTSDWLMTVFFFVVGLEIKRELLTGELASPRRALLPAIAAVGGMLVPALIYAAFNWGSDTARGWGIPVATDIAFVVGCLTILGERVPRALAVFIVALAIFDDIGGIAVIVVGYGGGIHVAVLGVFAALLVPRRYLAVMINRLHPWSAFVVVPIFALVNAGFDVRAAPVLADRVTLGVGLGLFIGKQLGVFAATALAVKLRLAPRPGSWWQVYGVSVLAGIGFTVSLFIAEIARLPEAKLGIFVGSLVSGIVGCLLLRSHRPQLA